MGRGGDSDVAVPSRATQPFSVVPKSRKDRLIQKIILDDRNMLSEEGVKEAPQDPGVYVLYPNPEKLPLNAPEYLRNLAEMGMPVYIGKADRSLRGRLSDHLKTVTRAEGLDPEWLEFSYVPAFEAVDAIAMEQIALSRFGTPPWNGSGFGGHAPGSGRPGQKTSHFDSYHQGRGRGEDADHSENRDPKEVEEVWKEKADRMAGADKRTLIFSLTQQRSAAA